MIPTALRRLLPAVLFACAPLAQAYVGGGLLNSGLEGHWFSDANFTTEAFQRRDIRLDFDWGTDRRPGGSLLTTRMGAVGTDNYSVRWTGQFMPRFSETYTFTAYADSVRIWIKPASQADWPSSPQIDYWPGTEPTTYNAQTASLALTAATAYDIKIEYRERTGTALMRLLWASPSTPQEVIQPTAFVAEKPPERGITMADIVYGASNWSESYEWAETYPASKDDKLAWGADNWPAEDFHFIFRPEGEDVTPGTYQIRFKGRAKVSVSLCDAILKSADGSVTYSQWPGQSTDGSQGYDSATNTTTLRAVIPAGKATAWADFHDTDRDGPGSAYGTNSGITDLQIMRPTTLKGDTPHPFDELFARDTLRTLELFTCFRENDVNTDTDMATVRGETPAGRWADRNPLGPSPMVDVGSNVNHEYKILLANAAGRDLYIQVPHRATDDYITKMAQLIRYGSDASGTPYTAVTADPVYPPLNPNLRVYVEYSNESPWNGAGQYPQAGWMGDQAEVLRQAFLADSNSTDGQRYATLNYDGVLGTATELSGMGPAKRFFALRTAEISLLFRSVFGDDAMPAPGKLDPLVRPLLMYQYDNTNDTAKDALFFLDGYFAKTDPLSTYTGVTRPVGSLIFGGGAATYYASEDRLGLLKTHSLTTTDGTFEAPALTAGSGTAPVASPTQPSGSPWTFNGTAGLYRQAARSDGTLGTTGTLTKSVEGFWQHLGYRVTVGSQDVAVYAVGRQVVGDNAASSQTHKISIFAAEDKSEINATEFTLKDRTVGDTAWIGTGTNVYILSNKFYSRPAILKAGKSYYILCTQTGADDYAGPTAVTLPAGSGLTIDGPARAMQEEGQWWGAWSFETDTTQPGKGYGPLNLRIATVPVTTAGPSAIDLGFVPDSRFSPDDITTQAPSQFSPQAAYVAGTGSASVQVNFPEAGLYGLIYSLSQKRIYVRKSDDSGYEPLHLANPVVIELIDSFNNVTVITPREQSDTRPKTDGGWEHFSYWVKPGDGFDFYGSAPIKITTPGTYTVRFSGTSKIEGTETSDTSRIYFLDNVSLASSAQMTSGTIPAGGGLAEGAPDVSVWEERVMSMYKYVQAFGLQAVSYEGGWYPGGDANQMPLQSAAAHFDPAVRAGEINAMNALARAGLRTATDFTFGFAMPDYAMARSSDYARMQAWAQVAATLPAEVTNGLPASSTFTAASRWWGNKVTESTLPAGGWMNWNIIAPASGYYAFSVTTTDSGSYRLLLDDATEVVAGTAGGTRSTASSGLFLTKGLHSLRLIATSGTVTLAKIACTLPGQAAGIAGMTAVGSNTKLIVRWPAVSGATSYKIYYKGRLDSTWTLAGTADSDATVFGLTGLTNDTTYNVVVTSVTDGAESAYSNMATATTTAQGVLLAWEFGNEAEKPAQASYFADNLMQVASLSMTGITPDTGTYYNTDAYAGGNDLPASLDLAKYYSFTASPGPISTMSLDTLVLGVYASGGATGYTVVARWSQDGFATSHPITLTPDANTSAEGARITTFTSGSNEGIKLTADLTGIPELHNTTQPVEFRFYFHGDGNQYYPYGLGHLGDTKDDVILYGTTGDDPHPYARILSPAADTRLLDRANQLLLEADVRDHSGALTTTWSKVSGPGTVTFADSTAATTSASFSADGTYVLRVTATNATGTATDEVTLAVASGASQGGSAITVTADGLGTVTARGDNAPNESKANAFDHSYSTKWLDFSSTSWLQYASTKTYRVTGYALTSANDSNDRDPKTWALLGSNDGTNWTTLDTRTGELFTARAQTKTYTVTNTEAFGQLRLRIDDTRGGGTLIQLAELEITGIPITLGAPIVAPGTAPAAVAGTAASLSGTATDADGTPQPLSSTWSKVSGPGTVTFGNAAAPATTATFSAAGTYVLRLSATDGGATVLQDLTVTVVTPYENWATQAGITGSNATASADPDGDGVNNLLEYALGTAPDSSASHPTMESQISNSKLQLSFTPQRTDVTYSVEASSDLATWTALTMPALTVGQSATVTDTVDLTASSKRFLRLKISQP